jgi:hypothetical protein
MQQYQPNNAATVTGDWAFLGSPPEENFADSNTAAQVTATVAQYQSGDTNSASGYIGVCYEPADGTGVTEVSQMYVPLNPTCTPPGSPSPASSATSRPVSTMSAYALKIKAPQTETTPK